MPKNGWRLFDFVTCRGSFFRLPVPTIGCREAFQHIHREVIVYSSAPDFFCSTLLFFSAKTGSDYHEQ
jgi:hypothetical protein